MGQLFEYIFIFHDFQCIKFINSIIYEVRVKSCQRQVFVVNSYEKTVQILFLISHVKPVENILQKQTFSAESTTETGEIERERERERRTRGSVLVSEVILFNSQAFELNSQPLIFHNTLFNAPDSPFSL